MSKTLVHANEATAAQRRVYFDLRDATDGITPETGEAAGQPQISTNGAAWTNTGIGTLSHIGNGRYYADLTQAAVATAGDIIETRYKSANTAESPGDSVQVIGFDPASALATQASVDTVDGIVDAILVDTAEIGAAGAGLTEAGGTGDQFTAIPWNAAWDAEVESEATDALNAYDPPTRAELTTDTNSILSKLLKYVQLVLRKDAGIATDNSTEVTAINANGGSGAGAFNNTTDSTEAIRDQGDAAWITASGTLAANVTQWNGSAVATPDTAGYPVVTIKDGTGQGEIATTGGAVDTVTTTATATTIGSTGIAAIWSYAKASAAALATTTIGRYIYDKLSFLTTGNTVTVVESVANSGEILIFQGESKTVQFSVDGTTLDLTGYTPKLALTKITSNSGSASAEISGSVVNAGAADQYMTFTIPKATTAALALDTKAIGQPFRTNTDLAYTFQAGATDGTGGNCPTTHYGWASVNERGITC